MKCGLNNSLSYLSFGDNTTGNPLKNEQLNFGVVTPPDKLPNASISNAVNSYDTPKKQLQPAGQKTFTAGKISAGAAFLAMGLSVLALLPFIRKH
ncbi:MAG: hypothetical protein LUE64_04315 [Candidatus Gastranaerophilales bacterium]|nr:hypothetical protein [Candidatus Gastranaerophilales bacterium]